MTSTELIKRGFHIFPLLPGGKTPYAGSWARDYTTNDPGVAHAMEQGLLTIPSTTVAGEAVEVNFKGCNWAVATGPSNLIVADVDMKKGKDGWEVWANQQLQHGLSPETLTVQTPTGGYHMIYSGQCKMGADVFGKGSGIDIRSHGSYIVAPGQRTVVGGSKDTVDGGYEILIDAPIAACPPWLSTHMGMPMERVEIQAVPGEEMTDAQRVELVAALEFIEPEGYDDLLHTGMEIHNEYPGPDGLEVWIDWCSEKFAGHNADTCEYKWGSFTHGEGSRTIASLFHNAREAGFTGVGAAQLDWASHESIPYVAPVPVPLVDPVLRSAADIVAKDIPKRHWILGNRYIKRYVTQIIAPGGVGKSSINLIDAVSIVTGKNLLGDEVIEQGNVWIHNAEDPAEETEMRIIAICQHFGIDHTTELKGLYYTDISDIDIRLVVGSPGVVDEAQYQRVRKMIIDNNIIMFTGDPMVRLHGTNENDNKDMDEFMKVLSRICRECDCSVGIIHHTRKLNGADGAGDMDAGRGASSVASAVRVQYTLTKMDEKTAEQLGVLEEDRGWYVRLCDAKQNMAAPMQHQRWLKRVSVSVPNGESVGTLEPAELKVVEKVDVKAVENAVIWEILTDILPLSVIVPLGEVVRLVTADSRWGFDTTEKTLHNRLGKMTVAVVTDSGRQISFITDRESVPGKGSKGVRCDSI